MAVHWFPGHMHKALKEVKEVIAQVDVIIEVLDARIPYSSENPEIAKIRGDKPCIKILNKADLADPSILQEWQAHLSASPEVTTITSTPDDANKSERMCKLIRESCQHKSASVKNIKAMIMGIPNVGKSTLINAIAKRTIAKTGNEPAVTKAQQRINLGQGIILMDTPGVLWPKLANPNTGYRLAASGAVKETAMEYDDVGFYLADYLLRAYPEQLKSRFQLDELPDTELDFLELIALKRGARMAGGRTNLHKICEIFVNECQSGKLGPICLETPAMVAEEIALMEQEALAKAAEKEARKAKFKSGSATPDKAARKEQRWEKLRSRNR